MITGVRDIYYNVTDTVRAKQFYIEVLGMKLSFEHEYWISLDCGGVQIGLHQEDTAIPFVPRDSHGAHAGATLTLASTDIKADRARIEAAGVKILGEADQPWGHILVFEDPDGNVLKLMKSKDF